MTTVQYVSISIGAASTCIAMILFVFAAMPIWDRFATRRMGTRVERCLQLGFKEEHVKLGLRAWGALTSLTLLSIWLFLKMPPVAVVCTFFVYVAAPHVFDWLIREREALLRDQLVGVTSSLANTVEAGQTLHEGLEFVTRDTPQPLAQQLQKIVTYKNCSISLTTAIELVRRRLQLEPFTLFAAALQVAIDRGGRLNESLTRIGHSLQENQRLERLMAAETASGRRVVQILALLPLVTMMMLSKLASFEFHFFVATTLGQFVMAGALLIGYVGIQGSRRSAC